jgi:hypothetical protein
MRRKKKKKIKGFTHKTILIALNSFLKNQLRQYPSDDANIMALTNQRITQAILNLRKCIFFFFFFFYITLDEIK